MRAQHQLRHQAPIRRRWGRRMSPRSRGVPRTATCAPQRCHPPRRGDGQRRSRRRLSRPSRPAAAGTRPALRGRPGCRRCRRVQRRRTRRRAAEDCGVGQSGVVGPARRRRRSTLPRRTATSRGEGVDGRVDRVGWARTPARIASMSSASTPSAPEHGGVERDAIGVVDCDADRDAGDLTVDWIELASSDDRCAASASKAGEEGRGLRRSTAARLGTKPRSAAMPCEEPLRASGGGVVGRGS